MPFDALTFLYLALGIGFLVLVVFLCVTLVYVIRILKDFGDVADTVKDTATRVNAYVLQPFTVIKEMYDHFKPFITALQNRGEEVEDTVKSAFRAKKKGK